MTNRHFSYSKTFIDPERRVALLLNPKVMTTFLRSFLVDGLAEFRGLSDPSEGRYRLFRAARRFPMARLRDYREFVRDPGRYRTYAFVRNPHARVWSAWADKFLDAHQATPDGANSGYPRSMRRGELRKARNFARKAGLPGARTGELVPFETFVAYVAATPPGRRNQHWEQQGIVLQQPGIPLHRAIRIENELRDGIADLAQALDFSPDWALDRLSLRQNSSSGSMTPPAITSDLARTIHAAFAPDFDRFGYTPGFGPAD